MTSYGTSVFVIIFASIGFLIQVAEIIFNNKKVKWYKKISFKGWGVILFAFVMGAMSIWGLNLNQNEKTIAQSSDSVKYDALKKDNKTLSSKVDTLRINADIARKAYEDSLQMTGYRMAVIFANGLKHGDKNVVEILANAISNKKDLIHRIDSMQRVLDSLKRKDEPSITSFLNGIRMQQKHDTLYLYFAFINNGKSEAKHFTMNVYFIYVSGENVYEFYKPIASLNNIGISPGIPMPTLTAPPIPGFHFDSSNEKQFMLMIGHYDNAEEVDLCYGWIPELKQWGILDNLDAVKNAHSDVKNIKYFGF